MPTTSPKLTKQEKIWRAEDDAHTLATAEEIKLDSGRMAAAGKKAYEMAFDARMKAKAMTKVASKAKPKARRKK